MMIGSEVMAKAPITPSKEKLRVEDLEVEEHEERGLAHGEGDLSPGGPGCPVLVLVKAGRGCEQVAEPLDHQIGEQAEDAGGQHLAQVGDVEDGGDQRAADRAR